MPEDDKSSQLRLKAVQLFSDLNAKLTTFTGALPNELQLGKPTRRKQEYRLDHWIVGERRTTVQYNKALAHLYAHRVLGVT